MIAYFRFEETTGGWNKDWPNLEARTVELSRPSRGCSKKGGQKILDSEYASAPDF